jgi:hypothetical protein
VHIAPLDTVLAPVPGLDGFADADVLAKVHFRADDVLLISGSLVDGSGTPSSDFDFCVIAPEQDDRFIRDTFPRGAHMRFYTHGERVKESFDYLPESLLGVNVEYWTQAEIRDLLDSHRRLYNYMTQRARKSSSFAAYKVDFRMLSRLCYAVPLLNAEVFEEITTELDLGEVCYTAFRTAVGSYPDFRDFAGMWAQGDYELALMAVRKLAGDTVRGLTHLHGNTNRNPKYLRRFVDRLPDELADLADRFRRMQVGDVVLCGDARSACLEWLVLIDEAYAAIRMGRDEQPRFTSSEQFMTQLRAELHSSLAWNAEISNEYSFRAREAVEGMPNLRELLEALTKRGAAPSPLPLQQWAADNEVPLGENNQTDR